MNTIKHNDLTLTLRGNAYLDHDTSKGAYYTTLADDQNDREWRVYWLLPDIHHAFSEPSDYINWNNPDHVELSDNEQDQETL